MFGVLFAWPAQAQLPTSDTLSIVFVGGQSNALNLHADASLVPTSGLDSSILFYYHSGLPPDQTTYPESFIATSDSTWTTLQTQVQSPYIGLFDSFFGPEMLLGRTLAENGWQNLAIFKVVYAGTHLAHDWKKGDHSMADAYDHFLDQLEIATDSLQQWNIPWKFVGMCWMQGESDAYSLDFANAYAENLTTFINDVRLDLGEGQLSVVLGKISNQNPAYQYSNMVRSAQQSVANNDPHISLISLDDQPMDTDGLHFMAQGVITMGLRFAEALLALKTPSSVRDDIFLPEHLYVLNAYPNPFNSNIHLDIHLEKSSEIRLSILDVTGKPIQTFQAGNLPAGYHEFSWQGEDNTGQIQPSGVYILHLKTDHGSRTRRLLLLK